MGNITLEQVLAGGGIVLGLAALGYKLWGGFKTAVGNAVGGQFAGVKKELKESVDDIKSSIDDLDKRIDEVDRKIEKVNMQGCKNFLVRCIADFENDMPNNETELERFWEQYDYYIESGGNSYIRHKVNTLEKQGKIKRIPAK